LDRGDLRYAMALAEEVRLERGQPISLARAARYAKPLGGDLVQRTVAVPLSMN
jgi:hypothetical protein